MQKERRTVESLLLIPCNSPTIEEMYFAALLMSKLEVHLLKTHV